MLQFHPPGIGQQVINTSLGAMVHYTPVGMPWPVPSPDSPIVLFLHSFGGGASAYEWSKVYPALITTHRVLVPDLIGWGESAHPERDYQIEDYLVTLAEFLEQTCSAPVTVVASSLTGAIAIRLAIERSDLINALFLVCPSGFSDFGQDAGRRLPLQVINTPLLDQLIYTLGPPTRLQCAVFWNDFCLPSPIASLWRRLTPTWHLHSSPMPNMPLWHFCGGSLLRP